MLGLDIETIQFDNVVIMFISDTKLVHGFWFQICDCIRSHVRL